MGVGRIRKTLHLDVSETPIKNLIKKQQWSRNYVGKKYNRLTIEKIYKEPYYNNSKSFTDCVCDCGNRTKVSLSNLKSGHVKSCGCLLNEYNVTKRKSYGWSAFNTLYRSYVSNAFHGRSGEKEFTLSKDDAMRLFKGNCFYCSNPPSKIKKIPRGYGEFIYNGIDRKDNGKGYTSDNCVSCCEFCNMTKNDTPFKTFVEWIRKVNEHTKDIDI